MTRTVLALLLDALLVLAFALIGRAMHGEPLTVAGVWTTWWPFLGGLVLGWLAVQAWRRPAGIWPHGVFVWAITLVGGMVLRQLTGQGTATAFVIVATLVLAAFLLGWRTVAAIAGARAAERGPSVAARTGALVPTGSAVGGAEGRRPTDESRSSLETAADDLPQSTSPDDERPAGGTETPGDEEEGDGAAPDEPGPRAPGGRP